MVEFGIIGIGFMLVNKAKYSILCLVAITLLASCHELRISTNKNVPPTFSFSTWMAECCTSFSIVKVFELPFKNQEPVWEIHSDSTIHAEYGGPEITYGKVPDKFVQIIPKVGDAPALVEGKEYEAVAGDWSYVPWPRVCFLIQGGKTVERDCPTN